MSCIIVDSGSTKALWAVVDGVHPTQILQTTGLNFYLMGASEIAKIISSEIRDKIDASACKQIFFYGTTLQEKNNQEALHSILKACFPLASIVIQNDLYAVAHGVCGLDQGIGVILGTGSGCFFYDGIHIQSMRMGTGYVLGDEGSATYLGKLLIHRFLFQELSQQLHQELIKELQWSRASILQKVYKEAGANRFLASLVPIIKKYQDSFPTEINALIENNFDAFVRLHLLPLVQQCKNQNLYISGGVAHVFQTQLEKVLLQYQLNPCKIVSNPMQGLIEYLQSRFA